MPWLKPTTYFNPDAISQEVIGVATQFCQHVSDIHSHDMGQFLFIQYGHLKIIIGNKIYMLPPYRLIWIPAHVLHQVEVLGCVGYRSVYIHPNYALLSEDVIVIQISSLLSEVLEKIALAEFKTDWIVGRYQNLMKVLFDEIASAAQSEIILNIPSDIRLNKLNINHCPPCLKELVTYVAASEKTINRIFLKDTGLTYQQWRQQWRLLKSIELLSQHKHIYLIYSELHFLSESAFIQFFKKMTGLTPKKYVEKNFKKRAIR